MHLLREENVQLNNKEDESKDEEAQEKGVMEVEDKSYINDNDEDCLVDEKIFKSDTDLQVENQTFDQDERGLTNVVLLSSSTQCSCHS